jgi:hypothetical protein
MDLHSRRDLMDSMSKRYHQASGASKTRILDEVCAATGFHRKYAISRINLIETSRPSASLQAGIRGIKPPRREPFRPGNGARLEIAVSANEEGTALLGKLYPPQKILISRLVPQTVKYRVHTEIYRIGVMGLVGFLQIVESLFVLARASI